ncbi:hypothetical protein Q8A67_023095 [Cirrhinus molitorella]|uniref:Uncharacterized protein n=1 Tax=Cirrhinus molitorella TaxID=172907 RepID=A0AA88TE23_9TELE|nr:hypothetical protein Q8A67_023095 [Cirrhinus molitorella]
MLKPGADSLLKSCNNTELTAHVSQLSEKSCTITAPLYHQTLMNKPAVFIENNYYENFTTNSRLKHGAAALLLYARRSRVVEVCVVATPRCAYVRAHVQRVVLSHCH